MPEGCDDLIFPEESDIAPVVSLKKSLGSWIGKVAKRAGVELWEKPFQNCRSSRDTELRKVFPEYKVNQWIGHTQKVAEAYYIQPLTGDFIDAYNVEKEKVVKMVVEHAGIGENTVEVEKPPPAESPTISTPCDVTPYVTNTYTIRRRPATRRSVVQRV